MLISIIYVSFCIFFVTFFIVMMLGSARFLGDNLTKNIILFTIGTIISVVVAWITIHSIQRSSYINGYTNAWQKT